MPEFKDFGFESLTRIPVVPKIPAGIPDVFPVQPSGLNMLDTVGDSGTQAVPSKGSNLVGIIIMALLIAGVFGTIYWAGKYARQSREQRD